MATAPKHRKICNALRPTRRCGSGEKRQAAKRTHQAARHGFLDYNFCPVTGRELNRLGSVRQVEQAFFTSLQHLATLYGLELPAFKKQDYPLNITHAFAWAKGQMGKVAPDIEVKIINNTGHAACIATVKTFSTGNWLFYVPVEPLYRIGKHPKNRTKRNLILSAFAYLHQIGGMPYFDGDFLGGMYEMIANWFTEDPTAFDEDDYKAVVQDIHLMNYYGDKLFKSIRHPYHLQQFQSRLLAFIPQTEQDKQLWEICDKLHSLWQGFPQRNFFENMSMGLLDKDPDNEECIYAHQYLSFFWSGNGLLYDNLMESINSQFQEAVLIEEPLSVQLFDKPQEMERHDLSFEGRLYDYLADFFDVLNEMP